jgi:AAA domain
MSANGRSGGGHDVVAFWRAVELFGPQPIPKLSDNLVFEVDGVFPWEDGHQLGREWVADSQAWQHTVYVGVHSIDDAYAELRRAVGDSGDGGDGGYPSAGDGAIAAFSVAEDGRVILGSQTLSSCAWATSRASVDGARARTWLDGFEHAEREFWQGFQALVRPSDPDTSPAGSKGEQAGEVDIELLGVVLDHDVMQQLFELVLELSGVAGKDMRARVHSRRVGYGERYRAERDFLNSFIASDLGKVAHALEEGRYGSALRRYLSSGAEIEVELRELSWRDGARRKERAAYATGRVEVDRELDEVRRLLSPENVPLGRWPRSVDRAADLGQQLAVNAILDESVFEGAHGGLFAVNGPPGTGKTTMLRDLIAALVVRRAERLAELPAPADGFRAKPLKFATEKGTRTVHRLKAELTGFDVVLACTTNAAAENVSAEIPRLDAIDAEWRGRLDYFGDIATAMLNGKRSAGGEASAHAWAMVAACLGSMRRCKTFATAFWFGNGSEVVGAPEGMLHALKACRADAPADWSDAVTRFRAVRARESACRDARQEYAQLFADIDSVRDAAERHAFKLRAARVSLMQAEDDLAREKPRLALWQSRHGAATRELELHRRARPRLLEGVLSLGRIIREWRARDYRLAGELGGVARELGEAERRLSVAQGAVEELAWDIALHENGERDARAQGEKLRGLIGVYRERWEEGFPGGVFPDEEWAAGSQRAARELRAPWIDEAWDRVRTELFLAALELHRAFVLGAGAKLRSSLGVAVDVIQSSGRSEVPRDAARAAWECLFMVVPVVSTTFASFPRLFRHLGSEEIGWLLIDEAGQSTPQNAAAPIWRSKHVVVVGDPMQLEPIVRLPDRTQRDLLEAHGVEHALLPSRCSVQTVADRLTFLGTFRDEQRQVWVGSPLNVHRRCEQPMFDVVNRLAYDEQMISHLPQRAELALPGSAWLDVVGECSQGHWVVEEGERVEWLLRELQARGVDFGRVFAIAPFRGVARRLSRFAREYPGITAGTIHAAQGKEADVVIVVLGGRVGQSGDKRWAALKPNLLNVAVSRAVRRLYVIGDRDAWSKHEHFATLAEMLPPA